MNALDTLKKYWGYDNFRPMQAEIIASVLSGHDTIGLLPTGGGKSITFQVPALMLPGLTVVVTPLVSLMKDQVDNLRNRNIPAACLHMCMTRPQVEYSLERCRQGKVKLLYVAPERAVRDSFQAQLQCWNVSMIVVDEAHCISQWGYDFRPSYLGLAKLRELFPDVPMLALTASATPDVVADIADKLEMRNTNRFTLSFSRDNISFLVRHTDAKLEKLLQVLRSVEGSAIVYVRSRKKTVEIARALESCGINATFYHAGLDKDTKSDRQDAWRSGETPVIVATTAFGMGIDKPDVRLVVHYDLPSTLEEYYQEAGRAGRDGKPSLAVLICNNRDKARLAQRLNEAFPPKDFIRKVYDEICRFLSVPMGEGFDALFEFNPETMCIRYHLPPAQTYSAISILERAGYVDFTQETDTSARVWIKLHRHALYDLELTLREEEVIQTLLRNYPGLFADYVFIDEVFVANACHISPNDVYQTLIGLRRQGVIEYIPRKITPYILFTANRRPSDELTFPRSVYEDRRAALEMRHKAMERFAFADDSCRVNVMLDYFGEKPGDDCGKCDVCRNRENPPQFDPEAFEAHLEAIFATMPTFDIKDLRPYYPRLMGEVSEYLRTLASQGRITLSTTKISKKHGH